MKYVIQYTGYLLTAIHFICSVPAILSFALCIFVLWILMHKTERITARQIWGQIVEYTKKVYE